MLANSEEELDGFHVPQYGIQEMAFEIKQSSKSLESNAKMLVNETKA